MFTHRAVSSNLTRSALNFGGRRCATALRFKHIYRLPSNFAGDEMSFGKIVIAGVEHDLTHLDPLVIRVTAKTTGSPTYNVHVSFGRHCFARELRHGDPVSHHVPDNGGSVRCFCPIRTTHSRHLSKIVRAAPTGPAFFSQGKNMLLVDWVPGVVGPYAVLQH